jgi:urease accessory protein
LKEKGKSGKSSLLSRSGEVSIFIGISQNARLISQFDGDRSMRVPFFVRKQFLAALVPVFFFLIFLADPVLAHHPFGMADSSELSAWQALLSGVGHPLLGPDHLLFMLGIALVGIKKTKQLVFPLLAVGLAGSALVQLLPLHDLIAPWAEALVSLSLAIEGLIALNFVNSKWLLPMFALHGYLLGSTIVGAEPTPLIGYFFGLLLVQGFLLLVVTVASQNMINRFGVNSRNLFAGILIGIGLAFSWVALVP